MTSNIFVKLNIVAVLVGCLTACSALPQVNLEKLYSLKSLYKSGSKPSVRDTQQQVPVILMHGTLGGRLVDRGTGEEAWPGSIGQLLFSDYRQLALPFDPTSLEVQPSTLKVDGINNEVAGQDYYGDIQKTLEKYGGYQRAEVGSLRATNDSGRPLAPQYYVFSYDWRQDNARTAAKLHEFILQLKRDYQQPDLKVDIIAHSMGGLVSRYYARYGNRDVLNDNELQPDLMGEKNLRRVILLGTPNLGSVGALRTLIRGYPVGLKTIAPEIVATFPSTYQLLPHAINDWLATVDGRPLNRDQFSAEEFWQRFGFSVFNKEVYQRIRQHSQTEAEAKQKLALLQRYFSKQLERARRFSWSLSVPLKESKLRYIVFGGDCLETPARAVVEEVDGESVLRLWPNEIAKPIKGVNYKALMFAPGDGTVSKASLLARHQSDPRLARHKYSNFDIDYPIFLCEKHDTMTANVNFQNNLLHALLSADR